MNNYLHTYQLQLKHQWQSMDWTSKFFAVLVCSILLVSGLFTGFFIFCTSLVIALSFYLKLKFNQFVYSPK